MTPSPTDTRPRPTLSIVIVNWNSKDYVDACLRSISDHASDLDPEVIVVDGGSFDGCDAMLAEKHPTVRFIQSQENLGFGRSNNLGIEAATGDIVALLNPDTELRPQSLHKLVSALVSLPNAGAVGPRLLNADGTLQTSCVQAFPTPINQALDSDFLRSRLPRSRLWMTYAAFNGDKPVPVEVLSGACIVAWRELLDEVGGFTNAYFMYAEDMDLCKKFHEAGRAVYHEPGSEIVHFGGGSSSTQFSKFSVVMNLESLAIYMRLRRGAFGAFWFRVLMALSATGRLAALLAARIAGRKTASSSIKRWQATLSWAVGMEKWTKKYRIVTSTALAAT